MSWTQTKAGHVLKVPSGARVFSVEARVDSHHPEAGCHVLVHLASHRQPTLDVRAFQIPDQRLHGEAHTDSFIRENKLIVARSETTSDPIESLHVFRDREDFEDHDGSATGPNTELNQAWWLEGILSQQTSTLRAQPIDLMAFSFPPDCMVKPLSESAPGHFLITRSPLACLVACHSSDFQSLADETDFGSPQSDLRIRLRISDLEKGVIRRCRFLIAVALETQTPALFELSRRFETSRLPLST